MYLIQIKKKSHLYQSIDFIKKCTTFFDSSVTVFKVSLLKKSSYIFNIILMLILYNLYLIINQTYCIVKSEYMVIFNEISSGTFEALMDTEGTFFKQSH